MKRVLIVSYIFPPMVAGGAPRMGQFAKYLPEFGWVPTILTVPCPPEAAVDDGALAQLPASVEIVRARCPLARIGAPGRPNPRRGWAGCLRGAKRRIAQFCFIPDWQILWLRNAVRAGREALSARPHRAVMATFGPGTNLLIGAKLAREFGLPLILDFRDLWVDNPVPRWITPLHKAICRRIETRLSRRATRLIGVSPAMCRHLRERHQKEEANVECIPNGFDPALLPRAVDRRDLRDENRPLRICFTGSVYGPTDFTALFQAVRALADEGAVSPTDLQIEFVGNMTMQESVREGVAEFVSVRPYVPHAEVFDVFAAADVLMLIEPPGYCVKYSYASKLFDYLLTGKPVLALIEEGENTARVLREAGVGYIAHPDDRAAIRQRLIELLQSKSQAPRPVDIRKPPYNRFDRRNLTGKLARALNEVAGTASADQNEPGQASSIHSGGVASGSGRAAATEERSRT